MRRSVPAAASLVVCLGVCLLLTCAPSTAAGSFVLRDDLGRDVTFTSYPQRIITLLPSLTETVCALDACDRLVATDRFSNWPAPVNALPKAGGLDDASMESIVALRPDLVLLSRSQRITERLAELGIPSFAVDTDHYADIARVAMTVGRILGLAERATTLVASLDQSVRDIGNRALTRRHGNGASIYYEVDRGPYAAGADSFIGELLTRLGTRNIVPPELGPFPRLNPEFVVRHDPDVIVAAAADVPHLAERAGWDTIRAVKEHRVCSFTPAVNDTIVRPGPRVAEGMRAIAQCLEQVAP